MGNEVSSAHDVETSSSIRTRLSVIRAICQQSEGQLMAPKPPGFQQFKNQFPWDKWSDFPRWDKRGR